MNQNLTRDVLIASDSRNVTDEVRAVLSARDYTVREVREIQFAGFAKAHRIPS